MRGPKSKAIDPDRREVAFGEHFLGHLAEVRPWLLQYEAAILGTIARPDHRDTDAWGRERFYRLSVTGPGRWLRVVVDFERNPGAIAAVLVQDDDPRWPAR